LLDKSQSVRKSVRCANLRAGGFEQSSYFERNQRLIVESPGVSD
jgi:hypothetical protein